jgi:hypothetical protein
MGFFNKQIKKKIKKKKIDLQTFFFYSKFTFNLVPETNDFILGLFLYFTAMLLIFS